MDENEKQLDTDLSADNSLEERDGVKYETNDNWQFDAVAPTLSDDDIELASSNEIADAIADEQNNEASQEPEDDKPEDSNDDSSTAEPVGDDVQDTDAPAEDDAKPAKNGKLKYVITAVLVAAIVAVLAFLGVRYFTVPNGKEGKQMNAASVVATVDGTKISIGMFNYCYSSLVRNSEQNSATNGLDTTKDYATQYRFDEDGNQISWTDYFKKTALEELRTLTAYYNAGVARGYEITESQQKAIDDYIDQQYKTYASEQAISLDQYLTNLYGEYVTEATFREFLKQYIIGATYQGYLRAEQDAITDEQIQEYLDKDRLYYSQINFCYIAVEYGEPADEAKVEEYKSRITDKDSILALVPEIYAQYISEDVAAAMEADSSLTEEEANRQALDTYSQSIEATISGSSTPFGDDINEWIFSTDTPIGDKNVYYDEAIGYAYIILKTEQPTLLDTPLYAVRHILVQPHTDDEEKQAASDWTDEEWAQALEKANQLLDEFNSSDKTERKFAELAEEHSEDPGSVSSGLSGYFGGFYEGVAEGYMTPEFENWSMDEARQYGDTEIVKTQYGYHIMFFVYNLPSYKAEIIYSISNDNALKSIEDQEIKAKDKTLNKAIDNYYASKKQNSAE